MENSVKPIESGLLDEIKDFLGPSYPESGAREEITKVLEKIAPSYWDSVQEYNIPPGDERKASRLLLALKYGWDEEYGWNCEAKGLKRG